MAIYSAGWGGSSKELEALFLLARAVIYLSEVPGKTGGALAAAEGWFSPGLGQIQPQLWGRQREKLVGCWHSSTAVHVQR